MVFSTLPNGAKFAAETTVTLKMERLAGRHGKTLKLIGRIRAGHLPELKRQIGASAPSALELKEVALVGAEAFRFLGARESEGIHLEHSSAYTREWIIRERGIKSDLFGGSASRSNFRQPGFSTSDLATRVEAVLGASDRLTGVIRTSILRLDRPMDRSSRSSR